jgi:hypothetical protein
MEQEQNKKTKISMLSKLVWFAFLAGLSILFLIIAYLITSLVF